MAHRPAGPGAVRNGEPDAGAASVPFPETLLNGSFTADMETYFADQFPLRDDWTGLKARCELLLGKREFNGVYLCGDTLIAKVEEPEAAQVEQNLAAVKKFAELTGGQVLLGLIPTAAEVWRDKLPAGAPQP